MKAKYCLIKKGDLSKNRGSAHAQYVDLFIKAANIVLHKKPDTTFMIVGEGFLERKLKRLVFELGIDDKVIFTGGIEHDKIPYYIASSTVCVAPFKDTLVTRCKSPLKIVEYLAAGKPVVASLVGEVRNIAGGCAVLVKEGDIHSLAEGILMLLEDKNLREKLGKVGRIRIEKNTTGVIQQDLYFLLTIK
jgi:glycosyltransferase involved in cell wall biosynthesis